MKRFQLPLAIISAMIGVSLAFGQVIIDDQDDWEDLFEFGDPFLTDWRVGVDYRFGDGNDIVFIIPDGSTLTFQEGANMDVGTGVSIELRQGTIIEAPNNTQLIVNPQQNQGERPLFGPSAGETWGYLMVEGTGFIEIHHADIWGGGSVEMNEHRGLFQVNWIAFNVEGRPSLFLNGCLLSDCSVQDGENLEGNGIRILTRFGRVELVDTRITGEEIGAIAENGIVNHLPPALGPGEAAPELVIRDGSVIDHCGMNGIYYHLPWKDLRCEISGATIHDNLYNGVYILCNREHEYANGMGAAVHLFIDNTFINNNGDPPNQDINYPGGYGVYVTGFHNALDGADDAPIGPFSMIFIENGTEISDNTWGGIRLYNLNPWIIIEDCDIHNNGTWAPGFGVPGTPFVDDSFNSGAGVKVVLWRDELGLQSELNIQSCNIYENGYEGISVSKSLDDPGNHPPFLFADVVSIIGNNIYDNGTNTVRDQEFTEFGARRGSNVHILQNLHWVAARNNYITGAQSGICTDLTPDALGVEWGAPAERLQVTNNIQSDAGLYGFYCRRRTVQGAWGTISYYDNNVFWDNGWRDNVGFDIPWTAGVRFDAPQGMLPNQFQNNIIGISDDYWVWNNPAATRGIGCTNGNFPGFTFNAIGGYFEGDQFEPDLDQQAREALEQNSLFVEDSDILGLVFTTANPGGADDDMHLRWNSPLINRGRFEAEQNDPGGGNWFVENVLRDSEFQTADEVVRDGSRNDIGAFGGVWAVEEDAIFPFYPYNLIDVGFSDLANDNFLIQDPMSPFFREELEGDVYLARSSANVPIGAEFDIGAGVYIEFCENIWLKMAGLMEVNGVEDNEVRFAGYEHEVGGEVVVDRWKYLYFSNTASPLSSLVHTFISDAQRGIYISGVPFNPFNPQRINIENCKIFDCLYAGIYIFASPVHVHGLHPNEDFPNRPNQIWNILDPVQSLENIGIRISSCDADEVRIQDTYIHDCGDMMIWSGETGIAFNWTDEVDVDNVTVLENGCCGFSVSDSEVNFWHEGDQFDPPENRRGSRVMNNGAIVDQQEEDGPQGAEIFLETNSYPDVNFVDIRDDRDANNHGLSIFKEPCNNPGALDAEFCFWDQPNPDEDPPPDGWFYWDDPEHEWGEQPIDFDPWLEEQVDLDDFDYDFAYGRRLFDEGEYEEALSIFLWFIENQPGSSDAIRSLRMLPECYIRLDRDFAPLYRLYDHIGQERDGTGFTQVARIMTPRMALMQDRFEDALEMLEHLAENTEDEFEEIAVRKKIVDVAEAVEANRVDSQQDLITVMQERYNLDRRLQELKSSLNSTTPPIDFRLIQVYPNPFNSNAVIRYEVPDRCEVSLAVYDLSGREVALLQKGIIEAGLHSTIWDASAAAAGVYVLRLKSGTETSSTKIVLVK